MALQQLNISQWSSLREDGERNLAGFTQPDPYENDSSSSDMEAVAGPSQAAQQWLKGSEAPLPTGAPSEKSVWFAGDEDEETVEELPRLIPRPYWRNKPTVPRTHLSNVTRT